MKLFHLVRDEDFSGVSGCGVVAEGVVFSSGAAVMKWLTKTSSIAIYNSIEELEIIHGHEGRTRVVWFEGECPRGKCRHGHFLDGPDADLKAPAWGGSLDDLAALLGEADGPGAPKRPEPPCWDELRSNEQREG